MPPAATRDASDIYSLTITFFSLLYTHNPTSFLASCSELATICDYVTHSGKGNMIVVVAYMATMGSKEMARHLAERERLPVHRLFLLFPRSRLCSVGMEKTRHRQTRAAENPHQSAATGQARERHTDGFSDRYLFLLVPRNLLFERRLPIC